MHPPVPSCAIWRNDPQQMAIIMHHLALRFMPLHLCIKLLCMFQVVSFCSTDIYIYLLAKYKVYIVRIRAFYLSLIVSAVVMYVYCSCF